MTIAVVNARGGVGKTTLAVNLAAALASSRRRVLLVDLDSQAIASVACGVGRRDLRPSTASCLLEKYPVLNAIRHTGTPNLDLLTGSIELANADVTLAGLRGRELALTRMLERVKHLYEVIVLDCPPGMSLLCINAIVAADGLIVPSTVEPMASDALGAFFNALDRIRTRMAPDVRVLGIALTMVDAARKGSREALELLRAEYREKVFHTEIRWTAALAEARAAGKTVFAHAPKSPSGDALRRLAGEILQRLPAIRH